MTLSEYLAHSRSGWIRRSTAGSLPNRENPSIIHRAMRYSLFAGGKRIRPLLAIAAAEAVCDAT